MHTGVRRQKSVDWLASEAARLKKLGVATHFVYTDLKKFTPLWVGDTVRDSLEEESGPKSGAAKALAKELGISNGQREQLLGWPQWHLAFDAWALAAAVTKQMPLAPSLSHKRIVMQAMRPFACARLRAKRRHAGRARGAAPRAEGHPRFVV